MSRALPPKPALVLGALILACALALVVVLLADPGSNGGSGTEALAPSSVPGSPDPEPEQGLKPIAALPEAPPFELMDTRDRAQRLADYRGRPVILNFWATWCPPCREEMPSMQRAHRALSEDGIAVMAINVGEDADTIARFLSEMPLDFPLPMDTDALVVRSYPVIGLPTTFVIDPQGRIAYEAKGEREWDDPKLLEQVRALAQ